MNTNIEVKPLRVLGAFKDGDRFRARLVFKDWSATILGDSVQEAEARAKALEAALDERDALKRQNALLKEKNAAAEKAMAEVRALKEAEDALGSLTAQASIAGTHCLAERGFGDLHVAISVAQSALNNLRRVRKGVES